MRDLERVVASMAAACAAVGVPLVTGDTKVVDKGKGDGIYVNTSGVGRVRDGVSVGPGRAAAGDAVIVSGPIGDHGIAVMAAREGIDFETTLVSDSAPVVAPVRALLDAVPDTHVLRDPTRGGLATALCEIAVSSKVGIRLEEAEVPVRPEVLGACELLGFDPLYVACEGRFLAILPGERADAALAAIRSQPGGGGARRVGSVVGEDPGRLVLETRIGSHRLLERLSGEQLPRIC
jgi:hydrogenase expression/formation protein HypE